MVITQITFCIFWILNQGTVIIQMFQFKYERALIQWSVKSWHDWRHTCIVVSKSNDYNLTLLNYLQNEWKAIKDAKILQFRPSMYKGKTCFRQVLRYIVLITGFRSDSRRLALRDGVVVCHCRALLDEWRKSHVFISFWEHQEGLSVLRLIRHQLEEALGHLRHTEIRRYSDPSEYACKVRVSNYVNSTNFNRKDTSRDSR